MREKTVVGESEKSEQEIGVSERGKLRRIGELRRIVEGEGDSKGWWVVDGSRYTLTKGGRGCDIVEGVAHSLTTLMACWHGFDHQPQYQPFPHHRSFLLLACQVACLYTKSALTLDSLYIHQLPSTYLPHIDRSTNPLCSRVAASSRYLSILRYSYTSCIPSPISLRASTQPSNHTHL